MTPLKKGDPCKVRLHTGEVVEAIYDEQSSIKKDHFVEVKGKLYRATAFTQDRQNIPWCRFVGPACVLVPIGENK